jgi:hypothetical protein
VPDSFANDYKRLAPHERCAFLAARDEFVATLLIWEAERRRGLPVLPRRLGVKPMASRGEIIEFAWTGGRALHVAVGKAAVAG